MYLEMGATFRLLTPRPSHSLGRAIEIETTSMLMEKLEVEVEMEVAAPRIK